MLLVIALFVPPLVYFTIQGLAKPNWAYCLWAGLLGVGLLVYLVRLPRMSVLEFDPRGLTINSLWRIHRHSWGEIKSIELGHNQHYTFPTVTLEGQRNCKIEGFRAPIRKPKFAVQTVRTLNEARIKYSEPATRKVNYKPSRSRRSGMMPPG